MFVLLDAHRRLWEAVGGVVAVSEDLPRLLGIGRHW
jgi:hypothetical protein